MGIPVPYQTPPPPPPPYQPCETCIEYGNICEECYYKKLAREKESERKRVKYKAQRVREKKMDRKIIFWSCFFVISGLVAMIIYLES